MGTQRRRLDVELVRRGLAPSRARATEAIDEGRVLVSGALALTAARRVAADESVSVTAAAAEFVSRGGHKLARGLDAFRVDVRGRNAVDVGASTGGFTDCLLQRGCAHVAAIDVGRGQLAWSIRKDPRVTVMERTNIRDLDNVALDPVPDICVVDVSFISVRLFAANLLAITAPAAEFILLIKPQYEAGRDRVGRGGIVREPAVHRAVLGEVVGELARAGLVVDAVVPSPLRGADGNVEFLAHARRDASLITDVALDDAVECVSIETS